MAGYTFTVSSVLTVKSSLVWATLKSFSYYMQPHQEGRRGWREGSKISTCTNKLCTLICSLCTFLSKKGKMLRAKTDDLIFWSSDQTNLTGIITSLHLEPCVTCITNYNCGVFLWNSKTLLHMWWHVWLSNLHGSIQVQQFDGMTMTTGCRACSSLSSVFIDRSQTNF